MRHVALWRVTAARASVLTSVLCDVTNPRQSLVAALLNNLQVTHLEHREKATCKRHSDTYLQ